MIPVKLSIVALTREINSDFIRLPDRIHLLDKDLAPQDTSPSGNWRLSIN
jgi:hypothetical protein